MRWRIGAGLPAMRAPGRHDRVLILVPHPDDEALACGGLIQEALRRGADVRVAVVTAGDAFSVVAHRLYPTEAFRPGLFIRLGRIRITESVTALARLGLPPSHVQFWGYPDGALEHLWTDRWSRRDPWRASRTQAIRSPYGPGALPGDTYSGECLLADIERALRDYRPTYIVYPHPGDFNRDHRSVAALTMMALYRLSRTPGWREPVNAAYIVHWGEAWPWPFEARPAEPLNPPPAVVRPAEEWREIDIGPAQALNKRAAIRLYRSQFSSPREARFLTAFARRTEPFSLTDRGRPLGSGVIETEPRGSAHSAGFSPASDLVSVRVARRQGWLHVQFATQAPLSPGAICRVDLRTLEVGGGTRWIGDQWSPAGGVRPIGAWSVNGSVVNWRLPIGRIGAARAVCASVALLNGLNGGREWDRSAWALWSLS